MTAIIACTQGDFQYIDEWIQHHHNMGIDLFIIGYNGQKERMNELPQYDYVRYVDFSNINVDYSRFAWFETNPRVPQHRLGLQMQIINVELDMIKYIYRDVDFVLHIDVDEFVNFPKGDHHNIDTFFRETVCGPAKYLIMNFYKDNGHIYNDGRGLMERFYNPENAIVYESDYRGYRKTVMNMRHHRAFENSFINAHMTRFSDINDVYDVNDCELSHFWTKSLEEWIERKTMSSSRFDHNVLKSFFITDLGVENNKMTDLKFVVFPELCKKYNLNYDVEKEEEDEHIVARYKEAIDKYNNVSVFFAAHKPFNDSFIPDHPWYKIICNYNGEEFNSANHETININHNDFAKRFRRLCSEVCHLMYLHDHPELLKDYVGFFLYSKYSKEFLNHEYQILDNFISKEKCMQAEVVHIDNCYADQMKNALYVEMFDRFVDSYKAVINDEGLLNEIANILENNEIHPCHVCGMKKDDFLEVTGYIKDFANEFIKRLNVKDDVEFASRFKDYVKAQVHEGDQSYDRERLVGYFTEIIMDAFCRWKYKDNRQTLPLYWGFKDMTSIVMGHNNYDDSIVPRDPRYTLLNLSGEFECTSRNHFININEDDYVKRYGVLMSEACHYHYMLENKNVIDSKYIVTNHYRRYFRKYLRKPWTAIDDIKKYNIIVPTKFYHEMNEYDDSCAMFTKEIFDTFVRIAKRHLDTVDWSMKQYFHIPYNMVACRTDDFYRIFELSFKIVNEFNDFYQLEDNESINKLNLQLPVLCTERLSAYMFEHATNCVIPCLFGFDLHEEELIKLFCI